MHIDNNIIIYFIIVLNIVIFFIGYFLGKYSTVNHITDKPKSFFDTNTTEKKNNTVTINEKKIVVDINTDNLEKKYDKLGDTKQSKENISSSVNKLKSMKG